jgi:hypothetical protein
LGISACAQLIDLPEPQSSDTSEARAAPLPLLQARLLGRADSTLRAHLESKRDGFRRVSDGLVSSVEPARANAALAARLSEADSGRLEIDRPQVSGHSLRLALQGASPRPLNVTDGKASAEGVLRDTDLVVTSTFDRVELLLILKTRAAPTSFDWSVHLGERLRAVPMADGGISLEDVASPGAPVWRIPPAFAIDPDGKRAPVALEWVDSHLLARLSTDDLRYPILVDPAFETFSWQDAAPSGKPPKRYLHAAAFDDTRNRGVVFGGSFPDDLADTWEWDGSTWAQVCPGAGCGGTLPGRRGHSMAFDSQRNVTVLFGGRIGTAAQQETWEWSGTTWTPACTGGCSKPSARQYAALAFDAQRGVSVLFGGYPVNQDTWTFNGSAWTAQCTTAPCSDTRPEARMAHAMAYDDSRKVVVLFGGIDSALGDTLQDTWEWNGTSWSKKCVAACAPPGKRAWHAMAYDFHRKRVVLVGGFGPDVTNGPVLQDTWEWDGTTWVNTATGGVPPLQAPAAFYDRARKRLVAFGGTSAISPASNNTLDQTWLYHARGAQCSSSASCDTGFCVDGVCCEVSSCSQCYSCDVYDAASGFYPGSCNPVRNAEDTSGATCSGTNICSSAAAPVCKKKSGQGCSGGSECASGNCVDGTCCSSTCTTPCKSCANAAGTCTTNLVSGSTDANSSPACGGNNVCDGAGACKAKQGQSCDDASDCATGYCVDGRCCADACTAACKSCGNAAGTCTSNVASETADPNASPACSGNDVCDGAGGCGKKRGQDCAAEDECASGFCSSGKCCDNACSGACDSCATGSCTLAGPGNPGSPSCSPYLCSAASAACPTSCTSSTQCGSGFYCDGSQCQPDKSIGEECDAKEECAGNVNCIDGVCCDGACAGPCLACTALKKGSGLDGACGPIANGADPRTAGGCSTGSTSCDADGKCNGQGACRTQAPPTTSCGNGTICEGQAVKGQRCNGGGDCVNTDDSFPCAPAACSNGVCTTSCVDDSGCDPDSGFCNLQGVCELRKPKGVECGADEECGTGHCADGVCCDQDCAGACERCSAQGVCELLGAGNEGEPSCSPFVCDADRPDCPDTCTSDELCGSTFFCKISDNTCQPRVNGTACVDADQCPDKNCVDGVCCETACDGQCERCNAEGKCVPVEGAPVGERPACAGHADCKGSCDGETRSECTGAKPVGTACGEARCAANIGRVGACDATAACNVADVACHPFVCGDSECKGTCEVDGDCQEGYVCADGDCQLSSSKCSEDGRFVVDADDESSPCDPYVCKAGSCLTSCSNTLDCQEGKVCNTDQGNGVCASPDTHAAADDGGCGCRAAGNGADGARGYALVLALASFGLLRRRRRRLAPGPSANAPEHQRAGAGSRAPDHYG